MNTDEPAGLGSLAGLSALDEPVRRRLYGYVIAQDAPVSREQAAAAAGIGRTLAAYHLDKLAEAGLLTIAYQRPPGRGGPGGGRPTKLYRPAEREFAVSVPPRAYDLLARLLVEAVEKDPSGTVRATLDQVARDTGRQTAAAAGGDLMAALRDCGYQPRDGEDGVIELRNCPFHRLAQDHRDLVCGLNLGLVTGILSGSSGNRARAAPQPRPDRCCVVVHRIVAGDAVDPPKGG
jgi:predicted ArsR family transcriptional regulator